MSALQKKLLAALALLLIFQAGYNLARYLHDLDAGDRFGGDFICFWDAAVRARLGDYGAIYQPETWRLALSDHSPRTLAWFVYPPFSLFGLQLIGGMSYNQAVAWWSLIPLPLYLILVIAHARRADAKLRDLQVSQGQEWGWSGSAILASLTAPFLSANLFSGQIGTLVAVLFLAATYVLPRRPILAGVFVGLIAIKPQLGLLFPLALIAAGQWRAIAAATVTIAALSVISLLQFGPALWTDYLEMAALFGQFIAMEYGRIEDLALAPYVSLRSVGVPVLVAAVAQATISLGVLASIVTAFRRSQKGAASIDDGRLDLRLGLLAAGALLFTPYALSYETPLISLAVIPLFVRAWRRGWDGWELAAVVALVVTPYAQILAVGHRVPFAMAALILAFGVLGRRYVLDTPGRSASACGGEPLRVRSA